MGYIVIKVSYRYTFARSLGGVWAGEASSYTTKLQLRVDNVL
jgi:hypothetical protein